MNLNVVARIAKALALLGFVLPWVVVSCSGTEIAQATGVQLMTGDIQPAGPLADAPSDQTEADPSYVVIAVFAVIALGLLASLALRGRNAAIALIAGAVLGIGGAFYAVEDLRGGLQREVSAQGAANLPEGAPPEMAESMRGMIRVETRAGYWVTVGALGAAAVLCLVTLFGAPARRET